MPGMSGEQQEDDSNEIERKLEFGDLPFSACNAEEGEDHFTGGSLENKRGIRRGRFDFTILANS